jgi:hypothetical protein
LRPRIHNLTMSGSNCKKILGVNERLGFPCLSTLASIRLCQATSGIWSFLDLTNILG